MSEYRLVHITDPITAHTVIELQLLIAKNTYEFGGEIGVEPEHWQTLYTWQTYDMHAYTNATNALKRVREQGHAPIVVVMPEGKSGD